MYSGGITWVNRVFFKFLFLYKHRIRLMDEISIEDETNDAG